MRLETVRLKALADISSGGGAPQDPGSFSPTGVPFVRAGSLARLKAGQAEGSLERILPAVAGRHGLREYPAGTIVFAKSGMSATKGLVHALRSSCYVVNHLAALIPKVRSDGPFMVRLLEWDSPSRLVRDSAYPSIRLSDIEDMVVTVPADPNERARIASILDLAGSLHAKRRGALEQLDTLAQSTFLDMFGDPASNPRGWPTKKFGDPAVGVLDRGVSRHRPRNAPELLGGPYPLVQTGEVANCDGYIRGYTATYSEAGFRQSKMWPAGTLCITIAANIAKTGILTFDACFPDSVVGFRSSATETVEFVRVWLSFLQKRLEDRAPESAQKNINLAILRDLDIPFPPFALQRVFAERVAAIESAKAAQRWSLAAIEALFESLQDRAFGGSL